MYLIAIFYGVFYVNEPSIIGERENLLATDKSLLADFFDKEHVLDTFRVALQKGKNNRRLKVILLLVIHLSLLVVIY
jgi:PCFT/HCP family folate transporter-like MFS transporter 1/3